MADRHPFDDHDDEFSIYRITPEKVQAKLEQVIASGKILDLSGFVPGDAHGDRYISAWALHELMKLRFPGATIRLGYSGDALRTPSGYVNVGNMLETLAHHTHPSKLETFREMKLRQFAAILGIPEKTLEKSGLLEQVPAPTRLEGDKIFGRFNLEKQKEAARELRAQPEWRGRPVIAILQSGSLPEKRLSNEQMDRVIEAVYQKNPNAVVIVVSDRQLLGKKFPASERDGRGAYVDTVDMVVEAQSLDEVGSVALAADQIITTDTLWAWWAAGCKVQDGNHRDGKLKPGELIELMTVANQFWQVPGSEAVMSDAVRSWRTQKMSGMIAGKKYREFYGQETNGIHQKDVNRLVDALKPRRRGLRSILQ